MASGMIMAYGPWLTYRQRLWNTTNMLLSHFALHMARLIFPGLTDAPIHALLAGRTADTIGAGVADRTGSCERGHEGHACVLADAG